MGPRPYLVLDSLGEGGLSSGREKSSRWPEGQQLGLVLPAGGVRCGRMWSKELRGGHLGMHFSPIS